MTVIVTAAVIEEQGRYLVTRRQPGAHLEGCWEFPGGKCEHGESLEGCLARELMEELGVRAAIGGEILSVTHEYPDRSVELHFLACRLLDAPEALLGQDIRWVERGQLASLPFPPADHALIRALMAR
jgi:mutator protein MutT